MNDVILHVGEQLSYEEERIVSGTPEEMKNFNVGNLVVVLVENPFGKGWAALSIPDSEFIRTKVSMTKSEVRTVSVGKLNLDAESIPLR